MTARLCTMAVLILVGVAAGSAGVSSASAQSALLRGPGEGQVRALVIGIDAYQHVRPLKGAAADARDIERSLRQMGVRDLTSLIDQQADRESVVRAIELLLQRTVRGDLILLSVAGHGAQEPERVKGSQPDGMDDVFLLPGFETTPLGSKQRIIGADFNHFIREFEQRGANVLFVADTCHGGGLTRDVDPRAGDMSFRQVPRYRIPDDAYVPVSTPSEAFLTELDFEKTSFLAAVDRTTKAPEVRIPGIDGYRGALSFAVARALEGAADADRDSKITLKELFTYVRQVVYQLSDQRQNPVTVSSPRRDLDRDVAFEMTRAVNIVEATSGANARPASATAVVAAAPAGAAAPVRIAALDGDAGRFAGLQPREASFRIVPPAQAPDLVWDAATGDVLAAADVIAYRVEKADLPSLIDRAAAVAAIKTLATMTPQPIRVVPDDRLYHQDGKLNVEIGGMNGRALVLFNIAGDGTVQLLYPAGTDPKLVADANYRLPVRVRPPFGSDLVVAVTSQQPMPSLEQALKTLNQRRGAWEALKSIDRYAPADGRIGATGIFTAP
jgi:hypothetical protein